MKHTRLTLTPEEEGFAEAIAKGRIESCERYGSHESKYQLMKRNDAHLIGASTEVAAAKFLGVSLNNVFRNEYQWHNRAKFTDLVGGIEVRGTNRVDGRLLIQKTDKDYAVYLLVIRQELRQYIVVGWCYGSDGKNESYWKSPYGHKPCYFVPQAVLRDPDEIKELIAYEKKMHPVRKDEAVQSVPKDEAQ